MRGRTRVVAGAVAVIAVGGIGAGVAIAAGSGDDAPLRGDRYDRATAAALRHVGGGTVVETEAGDDGAAYEVEIRREEGTVLEVRLDRGFRVIGSDADDDAAEGSESEADD